MLGTSVMIPTMLVHAMGGSDVSWFSDSSGIRSFNLNLFPPLFLNNYLAHNQGDKARVIQTLLFVAGINTLLQALFGTRLPAVVGGSYAYVIPIAYIISDSQLQQIEIPHEVSYPIFPFSQLLGCLRTTWK